MKREIVAMFVGGAGLEYSTFLTVDGEDTPVIVTGFVSVDSRGCYNPELSTIYTDDGRDTEIAHSRVALHELATARQELLAVFSSLIDYDYAEYCSVAAHADAEARAFAAHE